MTLTRPEGARRHDLIGIQCLRAIAAFMVVLYHGFGVWAAHAPDHAPRYHWDNPSAGVDIFFVISGVVMMLSVGRSTSRRSAAWAFLQNRLTRIVPLYWVMTTAKIMAVLAASSLVLRTRLDFWYVLGSYALLPVHDWRGTVAPVLPVGWTLTYEMFFYLLITAALTLRVSVARFCIPLLLVTGFIACLDSGDNFPKTIVIEFIFGIMIGHWVERLQALPTALASAVAVVALGILLTVPGGDYDRPLTWGIPAALVVGAVAATEMKLRRIMPKWLVAAGNASYATYLFPDGNLLAYYLCIRVMPADRSGLLATVVMSLVICGVTGQMIHSFIERPLLRWTRTGLPIVRVWQQTERSVR